MSSRRFKKERHPFRAPRTPDSSLDHTHDSDASGNNEEPGKTDRKLRPRSTDRGELHDWTSTWCPGLRTAVKLLLSARLCSVVWSFISDCDETFNYWEPLHYILHKSGFQTWEYSPVYAIRSYAYILLHALPLKVFQIFFHPSGVSMFYFLRLVFAVCSVGVDAMFYNQILKRFGPSVARMVLVFLIFSPGLFISTTAFLPSSFAMIMTTLGFALWFSGKENSLIFSLEFFVGPHSS